MSPAGLRRAHRWPLTTPDHRFPFRIKEIPRTCSGQVTRSPHSPSTWWEGDYRGSWCPCCNAQLRAFQRAGTRLAEASVKVVALSVDDAATTQQLVDKLGLTLALQVSVCDGVGSVAARVLGSRTRRSTTPAGDGL